MRRLALILLAVCAALFPALAAETAVVAPADAYSQALARHIVRWLTGAGVAADLVPAATLAKGLAGKRFAYLVMPKGTPNEMVALRSFRARGGKLGVFYSTSPELAALMGVKFAGYRKPVGAATFSKMVFLKGAPVAMPAAIVQTSANIGAAVPASARTRTVALWYDRAGRSTGCAALLQSDAGWWCTHVFLADGDEDAKAQFLAAAVGAAVPGAWDAAAWQRRQAARRAAALAAGRAQHPRPGEIHAVWDHSGEGLYPGDWPRTIRLLKDYHVTDLFVNVCGAGFAHYPSKVLPPSPVLATDGDQLAACLAAARGSGIRIHAWMLCFNAARATPNRLGIFSQRGWRLRNPAGGELVYLDPSNPALQGYLLDAIEEVARTYPVAGVHLDFVRWYENVAATEASPGTMTRFRRAVAKPGRKALFQWRANQVKLFVAAARQRVKTVRPAAWLTTAVLGKYPSCVDAVGQDWESWIAEGLVDYAVPMNYAEDRAKYASFLQRQGRTPAQARHVISGIGVTANESRLDALQVIDQVNLARQHGLAGVALFDLDYTLVTRILPTLRLGQF